MRFRLKKHLLSVLSTVTVMTSLAPNQAHAYDEDAHFYGTYAMARYAGIRHEVAARMALSAAWMDQSFISDPTSMIMLPLTGIKKRRLLHFPSSRVVGAMDAQTQNNMLTGGTTDALATKVEGLIANIYHFDGSVNVMNFMTETTEDNPFGSELLMQGLKEGNLMMAAGGLHTLEDSYAHAGTPAEQGHAMFWHWPDRPYASVEKYKRMVRAVFQAMVAIRTQLPPEALDCSVKAAAIPNGAPNCQTDAATLAQNYLATSVVMDTVSENILKNPDYVQTAMRDFLTRAAKAKYINITNEQVERILAKLPKDHSIDSYEAAERVIRAMLKKQEESKAHLIDIKYVLVDMGRIGKDATDAEVMNYVDSYAFTTDSLSDPNSDALTRLTHSIAHELLKWKVPDVLDDSHRMELEDDSSPIRLKEMSLRNNNMRKMIGTLFNGQDILFVENNTKDDVGFAREVRMDPAGESKVPTSLTTYSATFSLREKNQWDTMIFLYLFPDLKASDLSTLVEVAAKVKKIGDEGQEYLAKRSVISNDKTLNFITRKAKLIALDYEYRDVGSKLTKGLTAVLTEAKPIMPTFLSDIANTHMEPSVDDYFYRNPRLFAQYRANGTIKPLLGPTDVWSVQGLLSEAASQKAP